ncbi:MAG: hypothetical protein FJ297_18020 [Planctomycetes bacterium]|nr:hypothetical protein [Planctomycetota bacterium]
MCLAALESVDSLMMVGMAVAVLLMIGASALSSWLGGRKVTRSRGVDRQAGATLHPVDGDRPSPPSDWRSLAADPDRKIQAVKAYMDEHGCGLADAKRAVESHIGRRDA